MANRGLFGVASFIPTRRARPRVLVAPVQFTLLLAVPLIILWLPLVGCGGDRECGPGTHAVEGECRASEEACAEGTHFDSETGLCQPDISCAPGTVAVDGQCVPDGSVICESGTSYDPETGRCRADITGCGFGTVLVGGECIPEDDARQASLIEDDEPNDKSGAGSFAAPAVGALKTLSGCIVPVDEDGDGDVDMDIDRFRMTVDGPTLFDISADGVDGLAAAFHIRRAGAQISSGWERYGLNLVGDTSQRQVFFPKAGSYFIEILDSRSIFADAPVGSPESCYFVSVRGLTLPTTTPFDSSLDGVLDAAAPLFLSYSAEADGDYVEAVLGTDSPSAQAGVVHLNGGEYAADFQGGDSVSGRVAGLTKQKSHLIVIEPVFHYALDEVAFSYSLERFAVPKLVQGGTTSVSSASAPRGQLVWFEGKGGDVHDITLNDANLSLRATNDALVPVDLLCKGCTNAQNYYQTRQSGPVYLHVSSNAAGPSFDVNIGIERITPTAATTGDSFASLPMSASGSHFLALSEPSASWPLYRGSGSNLTGELELLRYSRSRTGFLDVNLDATDSFLVDEEGTARILHGGRTSLFRIRDTSFDGNSDGEAFSLDLSEREPTVVAADANIANIAIAAGERQLYWLEALPSDRARLDLTNLTGTGDLRIEGLASDESAEFTFDEAGPGQGESREAFFGPRSYLPIAIVNQGEADSFDLTWALRVPDIQAASSGEIEVFPGAGPVTASGTVIPSCVIEALRFGIDVRGANIGDMQVDLESPAGTVVRLRNPSGSTSRDLRGRYPVPLSPSESLDAFAGEDAMGTWHLHVQATTYKRIIRPFALALYCAN